MSEGNYKDWILETIDQLRNRKARPDLERICHMVERKHGLTFSETEAELEKLVDSEIVIKVDYKGSTSYRNAAKWKKSHVGGQVLNSNQVSRQLHEAMHALTAGESGTGRSRTGTSYSDIENWLVELNGGEVDLEESQLQTALQREVDCRRFEKLPNGNYAFREKEKADKPDRKSGKILKMVHGNKGGVVGQNSGTSPGKRGRPPTKRKRIKKSPGPEFESYDVAKVVTDERCDYCLQTAAHNRRGKHEDLLICKDCNAKAHPSCMEYSEELAKRARKSPWQCIDCKTCYICDDSGDADAMLFCDACDKGYHMTCHNPMVTEKPQGKWVCAECVLEGVADSILHSPDAMEEGTSPESTGKQIDGSGPSCLPTPCDSPVQDPDKENDSKLFHPTPPKLRKLAESEVPDASEWTIEEVVDFFKSLGFQQQADAFREQEIDGKSLLLMRRSDVLSGLSLKLGHALKIYVYVQRLQTVGQPFHY
ncbi:histone acetyltransferase KAT6B-like [Liolophura sinensis]|uniref:histone acetyltransferase KAT6B-like n=1 Tax=Liolophura sinensis TaxID=3198878 RepID=UPI0031594D28